MPATESLPVIEDVVLTKWSAIVKAAEHLSIDWLFRGEERVEWNLQTSIQREFPVPRGERERTMLMHFQRRAPHWLPPHLVMRTMSASLPGKHALLRIEAP